MPKKRRRRTPSKRSWISFATVIKVTALLTVVIAGWLVYLDIEVRKKFDGKKWAIPARVYAQPLELYEGLKISPQKLQTELVSLGYSAVQTVQNPGNFSRAGGRFTVYTKGFSFWDKTEPAKSYNLTITNNQITALTSADNDFILRLEPQEIGSIYPQHGEDRILTTLTEIPPLLGETLIAVEDKEFARHFGLSFKGIARAMWANIRAGRFVQGGSTITQQLVKNFYLTHRRSLWRKIQEALMSVLLELRYSKAEILEAYINEVYLGQSGPRAIHGFGLAAQHYFNRPLRSLSAHQIALLVGTVKGASYYNPLRFPERAKQRRDLVLELMAASQLIDQTQLAIALRQPLGVVVNVERQQGNYPAFLDLVKRQLQQDYRAEDLQSEGLRIFTTMSTAVQKQTEAAVVRQLQRFEQSPTPLQAAAVVTAVGSGEVLAVVGDSKPRYSGFNRALDAERHIGSLVKPFVYLAGLLQPQRYHLASLIDDSDVTLDLPNGTQWQPKNFTGESHGEILLHQALAFSYNQATARLGLDIGVAAVVETLEQAGLNKDVGTLPSLLLGALPLTPFEVSHLYHTLAADGVYTPLRAIRSVLAADNQPLQRYVLNSEPRFSTETSYLMHYALQAVMRTGTGRRVYSVLPAELSVAGKTGTTNEQRDSWFAGYSGDHLAVVWVGNDDNQPTQLTGSSGALPIWLDLFRRLDTQPISQAVPETVEYYWIDSQNGLRSAEGCPGAQLVPFIIGSEPEQVTDCNLARDSLPGWLRRWFR